MKLILFYNFEFLEDVLAILKEFGIKPEIIYDSLPEDCFNKERMQIDANKLLDHLTSKYRDIFAGITDRDMYVNNFNFVFGVSIPFRGFVLSTYRLKSNDKFLYKERVIKEFLHEFGHLLGLKHCENFCVMRFSNSVLEVDEKPPSFCEKCRNKLRFGLRLFSFYGLL